MASKPKKIGVQVTVRVRPEIWRQFKAISTIRGENCHDVLDKILVSFNKKELKKAANELTRKAE